MPIVGRFSLRTSLFLLLALLAALAGAKQIVTLLGDRTRTEEAALNQLYERAQRSTERGEHLIADVGFVLRQVSLEGPGPTGQEAQCQARLAALADELDWLTNIAFVATDGLAYCSSLPPGEQFAPIGDRDYFQAALQTRAFAISDFLISRRSGNPIVVAALPRLRGDDVQDVIVGGIDLGVLGLAVADLVDEEEHIAVALFDRNGRVVAVSPGVTLFTPGEEMAGTELWNATTGPAGALSSVSLSGQSYIAAYADLPSTGGRLIAFRDRAVVLADANGRAIISLSAMALAIIVICLLVWLGGELLVLRPLNALRRAAQRVAAGEFARVDVAGFVPELRQLGERFNAMSEALAERDAALSAANLRLAEVALRDGLTNLGNRRAFDERIEEEGARCARDRKFLSLLLVDVDHFKQFNDRYGHFAGDDALRRVASTVASGARRASDFAARIGGEEFALILPDCTQSEALTIARRLVSEVEALRITHEASATGVVTVSVGVAGQRMTSSAAVGALLENADQALYAAKRQGRNNALGMTESISLVS